MAAGARLGHVVTVGNNGKVWVGWGKGTVASVVNYYGSGLLLENKGG